MSANDAARGAELLRNGKHAPKPVALTGVDVEQLPDYDDEAPWPDEPPPDHDGPQGEPIGSTEGAIQHQLYLLRIRHEARRRLDDENRPRLELPPIRPLSELLAEPDAPAAYRIDRLAVAGSRVMLSAQYKAGKTTVAGNLVRSLADGTPFLGRFDVIAPPQRIAVMDNELGDDLLRRWLREQNITNTEAVADTVSLRGRVSAFNPLDDRNRAEWAQRWRDLGIEYLVLDCLRPVFDALGLDENHQAGEFLVAYDQLLSDAGITDSAVVHHMGHSSERARGDSRLQDWPDAIWRIMRENEQPDSPRYFSAFGRDVNVTEGRLSYEPVTRRLTYASGSRVDNQTEAARTDVVRMLAAEGAKGAKPNRTAIESELSPPHPQKAVRKAIASLIQTGVVSADDGPRNSKLHYFAHPCEQCCLPVVTGNARHESCPSDAGELVLS